MRIARLSRVTLHLAGRPVIQNLSLTIRAGEVLALIGPRGAGKSVVARILAGHLDPDEGGTVLPKPEKTGYLPQERDAGRRAPILRYLMDSATRHDVPRGEARKRAMLWLERLDLAEYRKERFEDLPATSRYRLQLAATVLHRPKLVILDEPFAGVPPAEQDFAINQLREQRHARSGVAIAMSNTELVERSADHVLLLNKGREVLSGSLEELRGRQYSMGTPSLRDLFDEAVRRS